MNEKDISKEEVISQPKILKTNQKELKIKKGQRIMFKIFFPCLIIILFTFFVIPQLGMPSVDIEFLLLDSLPIFGVIAILCFIVLIILRILLIKITKKGMWILVLLMIPSLFLTFLYFFNPDFYDCSGFLCGSKVFQYWMWMIIINCLAAPAYVIVEAIIFKLQLKKVEKN